MKRPDNFPPLSGGIPSALSRSDMAGGFRMDEELRGWRGIRLYTLEQGGTEKEIP